MKTLVAVLLVANCSFVQPVLSKADDSPGQLRGRVDGIDVVLEEALFRDAMLNIETKGKDGFEARFYIRLPIEIGAVPELKEFSEDGKTPLTRATFRNRISVSYSWKELASGKTVSSLMKRGDFQLELEFGRETEEGIAGQLSLKNAELGVEIVGAFVAEIRGLRLVDGHPDLQCDHRETLVYAGELFLRKKLKSEAVKLGNVKDFKTGLKAGDKKAGWLDGEYKDGDGEAVFVRLQFIKNDKGWRVFRQLRADQLVDAHPIVPFDPTQPKNNDAMVRSKMLDLLTARALEADLQKEFPGRGFSAHIGSSFSFAPKTGVGYNRASYTLHGEKERVSRDYLLRMVDGLWQVERALEDGEKVNTKTGKVERFVAAEGKTLCEAAAKGDPVLVKALLKKDADINAKDIKGVPPLVYAAAEGYEQIVKMLIDRGADVDAVAEDGRRALYISVARADSRIVKSLIEAKANVNLKNGHGSMALHTAAVWDRPQIARMLIDAGAEANAIDEAGNSPLDLAQWWSSEKTARLLKASGAETVKASKEDAGLMGRVHGMEIVGGRVEVDSGMFVHFYGNMGRINPPVVTIYLNTAHGVLPAGGLIEVQPDNTGSGRLVNNVLFKYSKEIKGKERSAWLGQEDYDLELTFGEEKGGMLEGKIMLNAPNKDVRLKGSFKAKVTGLRMIDGHPDLCSDSFETLRYAAKLYLQEKLGKDDVEVSDAGGDYSGWFNRRTKIGGVDVNYRLGDDSERFLRVQLRKGQWGWEVAGELKGNELHAAHRLIEVDKGNLREYFLYMVAQRLEKDLQKETPDGLFRSDLGRMSNYSRKHGIAEAAISYQIIGENKDIRRRYLLRRVGKDWVVERALSDNEKLNRETGKIEKK